MHKYKYTSELELVLTLKQQELEPDAAKSS